MKRKRLLIVSYSYTVEGVQKFARAELGVNYKISTFKDIEKVEKEIKLFMKLEDEATLCIMNIIKLPL